MATVVASTEDLKRIGFMKSAAESSVSYLAQRAEPLYVRARGVYDTCKDKSALKPGIESIENAMVHYGCPLVERAQVAAPQLLKDVDTKVDNTIVAAAKLLEKSLSYIPPTYTKAVTDLVTKVQKSYPENLKEFYKVREEYFQKIESTIETLKVKLPELQKEAVSAVTVAIKNARESGNKSAKELLEKVVAAWEALLAQPAVKKVMTQVPLVLMMLKKRAITAVNQLQESEVYQSYQNKAIAAVTAVQENPTYQQYLLPYVDPTVEAITSSAYYATVMDKVKLVVDSFEEEKAPETPVAVAAEVVPEQEVVTATAVEKAPKKKKKKSAE